MNHYLNWEKSQQRLKGIATRAVSQSNISATRLSGFSVPVPSTEIQAEISAMLDLVDFKISNIEKKENHLNDLFHTLLSQLMTAQIRVDDIDLSELGLASEKQT